MSKPSSLPGPMIERWDWQLHGRCRGVESSVFFHPDGERGRARLARETRAKQLCSDCPVLVQCREHALAHAEPYGIWGGMSESEREMVIRGARGHRGRDKVAV